MSLNAEDIGRMIERSNMLESHKNALVTRVEEFINDRELLGNLGYTQFQDLVGKANMTSSVKEITNFIRYQVGRDSRKRGWARENFGNNLVREINVVAELGSESGLSIELVRLFLGYLQRHVRYLRP